MRLPVIILACTAALLAGCTGPRALEPTHSSAQVRMIYPSQAPTDGVFVAIRGRGDQIVLAEDDLPEAGPPTVRARPIVRPTPDGEFIERLPVFIEPGQDAPPLPLPPLEGLGPGR